MAINPNDPLPVAVNTETAARLLGISRSSIFGLIANKSVLSTMIAGRRVILYADLTNFAQQQFSAADPGAQKRATRALVAVSSKRRPSPIGTVLTRGRT